MPYIGPNPAESFTSFATQEFSTSSTTSYTLDHAVANENEIALFINNVRQQPGSGKAYTATGTALTLSAATASTDTMYCVFLGRALQTVNPATNSISTAMISDNAVTAAKISESLGIVLQVVNGTNNTNTTTTNTSYTDTSITASITPSSTSNKILVFASVNGAGNVTASKQSYFSLYRDTTARIEWFSISGAAYNYNANSIGFLDSPSSTSALAYNIKIKSESGGTAVVGAYNSYSSLVLMEIKA